MPNWCDCLSLASLGGRAYSMVHASHPTLLSEVRIFSVSPFRQQQLVSLVPSYSSEHCTKPNQSLEVQEEGCFITPSYFSKCACSKFTYLVIHYLRSFQNQLIHLPFPQNHHCLSDSICFVRGLFVSILDLITYSLNSSPMGPLKLRIS